MIHLACVLAKLRIINIQKVRVEWLSGDQLWLYVRHPQSRRDRCGRRRHQYKLTRCMHVRTQACNCYDTYSFLPLYCVARTTRRFIERRFKLIVLSFRAATPCHTPSMWRLTVTAFRLGCYYSTCFIMLLPRWRRLNLGSNDDDDDDDEVMMMFICYSISCIIF